MDQSQVELILRAIRQTLADAIRLQERRTGSRDVIIRRLQRLEVLISGIDFVNQVYQQQIIDILHDISSQLETMELVSETESESQDEKEDDETLPQFDVGNIYDGR